MRTLSLTVVVNRDDDRFVAQCLEVDVSSFGDTHERALAMIPERWSRFASRTSRWRPPCPVSTIVVTPRRNPRHAALEGLVPLRPATHPSSTDIEVKIAEPGTSWEALRPLAREKLVMAKAAAQRGRPGGHQALGSTAGILLV